jgi:hypothetical protein
VAYFLVPGSRQTPQEVAWCASRSPMTMPGAASDANSFEKQGFLKIHGQGSNAVASNKRIREETTGSARMSALIPMLDSGRRVSR